MRKALNESLDILSKNENISLTDFADFRSKINSSAGLTRDEHSDKHICAFYLPVEPKNRKVYLIIHNKSGLWMPPGGHIDKGESSLEAIRRECKEELNFQITTEPVELYTLSIENINNPKRQSCKKHYSFWYLVKMKERKFDYNKVESGDGRWVTLNEAKKLVTFYSYVKPIASLSSYLEL